MKYQYEILRKPDGKPVALVRLPSDIVLYEIQSIDGAESLYPYTHAQVINGRIVSAFEAIATNELLTFIIEVLRLKLEY